MIIIITGEESSGKSVALEILKSQNFQTFNFQPWIIENMKFNNFLYNSIKNEFSPEFITKKKVLFTELNNWIKNIPNKKEQTNYRIKLNNLLLPIIKKQIIELKKSNQIIFVELNSFLDYKLFFRDVVFQYIFIQINPKKTYNHEHIVKNFSTITQFKINLLSKVKEILFNDN